MTTVRKGQAPGQMSRDAFHAHFQRSFFDPAFDAEGEAIARLEAIAWDAYAKGRKAPRTEKAGPGFADPEYQLSVEWRQTRDALIAAEARQKDPTTPSRVLLIIGASRNDGTCPGEISKSFRLANAAEEIFRASGIEVDRLDLSLLTPITAARFTRAKPASRPPCRSAIGLAAAIPTTRSARRTIGWRKSIGTGFRRMA